MAKRFSVEAVFRAVDRVTAPVTKMQNRVGKFTRSMNRGLRSVNRQLKNLSSGIKKVAAVAAAGLVVTSAAMAKVISTGAEFEKTIVSAAVKFPGEIRKGTAAFEELELAARKTGSTTEFTATQSAQALNFLAMAGFNASQAVASLPGVVDLATAAEIDLATATDIASDTLGAFGLMVGDTTQLQKNLARVNDVLAKTTTSANTDMETMFETMKQAGATIKASGSSLETFAALTGILANSSKKGSQAGTTLRAVFTRLSAPVKAGSDMLKKLGIETQDSAGNLRDMTSILGDVERATNKMGTAQKAAALKAIFGEEALTGVNILLAAGEKQIVKYRRSLIDSTGAASTMATVMRDTVQGRMDSFKSAVEGVTLAVFALSSGPISSVIDQMIEWVRMNGDVIASNLGAFISLVAENAGELVSAIGDIALGVGSIIALGIAFKAITVVLGIINLLMAANPIVLGIMAAVAAVALLSGALDPVIEMLKSIGGGISSAFSSVSRIGEIFGFGDGPAVPESQSIVSPQDRAARSIEERSTTSTSEVTIRPAAGVQADMTGGTLGGGLTLNPTGGF